MGVFLILKQIGGSFLWPILDSIYVFFLCVIWIVLRLLFGRPNLLLCCLFDEFFSFPFVVA